MKKGDHYDIFGGGIKSIKTTFTRSLEWGGGLKNKLLQQIFMVP